MNVLSRIGTVVLACALVGVCQAMPGEKDTETTASSYPNLTGQDWTYGGGNGEVIVTQVKSKLDLMLTWKAKPGNDVYEINSIISEKSPGQFFFEGSWRQSHPPGTGKAGDLVGRIISNDAIDIENATGPAEVNLQGLKIRRNGASEALSDRPTCDIGLCTDRESCRPFGNPPNQLCHVWCGSTYWTQCQTNIGCPPRNCEH